MKKKYYVSYFYKNNDDYGISNAIVLFGRKIRTIEDITYIEVEIAKNRINEKVTLINWMAI
jgi:hypothetical protein